MSDYIKHVSDESFEPDVLKAKLPVVVDFWAEWCGPCRAIAPVLEELAHEYADKVKFVKVNVDQNQETPEKYGVRGIPTLILVKEGKELARNVGALSKAQLADFLKKHIEE